MRGTLRQMFSIRRALCASDRAYRALIHIGKCGGASVRVALQEANMATELHIFHVRRPVYRKNLRYIVVARNPLESSDLGIQLALQARCRRTKCK